MHDAPYMTGACWHITFPHNAACACMDACMIVDVVFCVHGTCMVIANLAWNVLFLGPVAMKHLSNSVALGV